MIVFNNLIFQKGMVPLLIVSFLFSAVIVSCQSSPTEVGSASATPISEVTPTKLASQTTVSRATPTVTPTATPEGTPLKLTFWTIESISPDAEGEAGNFIGNSLRAFERAHPEIDVQLQLKKATGKGGVVDFLRTAKNVLRYHLWVGVEDKVRHAQTS